MSVKKIKGARCLREAKEALNDTLFAFKYFKQCRDREAAKTKYHELVKQNHPDRGGKHDTIVKINVEFDIATELFDEYEAFEQCVERYPHLFRDPIEVEAEKKDIRKARTSERLSSIKRELSKKENRDGLARGFGVLTEVFTKALLSSED